MRESDPRAQRSRAALLSAASQVLGERGPAGVTVDAVASAAGVARSTVYRHYPDMVDLLVDAVAEAAPHGPVVDTGSVVEDVTRLMLGLSRSLAVGEWSRLLPSLLLSAQQQPRTARVLAAFVDDRRQHLVAAVERGRQRGELAVDARAEQIADLLAGAVYYRLLLRRTTVSETELGELVDVVLATFSPEEAAPDRSVAPPAR